MSSSFFFLPRGRFTWALLLAFLLCACGGGSPESAAEAGVWAMAENRAEDFIELHSSNTGQSELVVLRQVIRAGHENIKSRGGLESVKADLVGQEGEDKAVVKVEITYRNGRTETGNIRMVKESGEWKLLFS
ncbi:MAG: DUF4878 domain-containing protein [Zoogloeaceae bacterium]|jgi:hypothetical protein|nr:DUF4878 domain-containing protein [Zoogloeaceae bacterium]